MFHHNFQFSALLTIGGPVLHQKLEAEVCVPIPPIACLAVFIVFPVAQAPTVVAAAPLTTLSVELYQTCPVTGFAGSDAKTSIFVPKISL
jgi:hypothetical protein